MLHSCDHFQVDVSVTASKHTSSFTIFGSQEPIPSMNSSSAVSQHIEAHVSCNAYFVATIELLKMIWKKEITNLFGFYGFLFLVLNSTSSTTQNNFNVFIFQIWEDHEDEVVHVFVNA